MNDPLSQIGWSKKRPSQGLCLGRSEVLTCLSLHTWGHQAELDNKRSMEEAEAEKEAALDDQPWKDGKRALIANHTTGRGKSINCQSHQRTGKEH